MKKRPAETAGAVVATGGIVAAILAHQWAAVGIACAGYVPAAVTFIVAHGGVRGVLQTIWKGSNK